MSASISRVCRIESQCGPELRRLWLARRKLKTLRHHADDVAFQAVEVRLPPHDMGITRKNALPGAVGNIGHHLRSWYIVRLRYQASLDWRHGKRFQEPAAHVGRGDAHGLRVSGQVCSAGDPHIE